MKRRDARHLVPRARNIALACGLALAVASPSWSAPNDYPRVLRNMVDAGKIQVMKQFATDKPGLTGYLVKRDGYQTVIYGEDGYLMLDPLYGPQGTNLSERHKQQYQPKPDVATTIDGLDPDRLITQGPDDAPTLYVFLDPDCIFCHKLYQRAKPLIAAGKLQIYWIMVGVLGPSSVGRAAAILSAEDPVAALARDEAAFDVGNEQGGVAPQKPSEPLADVLDGHRQAMSDVGERGTPTVLFRDANAQWQARQGMPPSGWLKHYARSESAP